MLAELVLHRARAAREVQRELAQSVYRFPIVFVTAHANGAEEAQAMKAGASEFFRKPDSDQTLIYAIEVPLGRKISGESGESKFQSQRLRCNACMQSNCESKRPRSENCGSRGSLAPSRGHLWWIPFGLECKASVWYMSFAEPPN